MVILITPMSWHGQRTGAYRIWGLGGGYMDMPYQLPGMPHYCSYTKEPGLVSRIIRDTGYHYIVFISTHGNSLAVTGQGRR